MQTTTTDLTQLPKDELLALYKKERMGNVAHRLWCLGHPTIPEYFSCDFVTLLDRLDALQGLLLEEGGVDSVIFRAVADVIYVDCRSMFCERDEKLKNYTLQNCLKIAGYRAKSEQIDKIFAEKNFSGPLSKDFSFDEWVRKITNRKIAHKDRLTPKWRAIVGYRFDFFCDPNDSVEFTNYLFRAHSIYEDVVMQYADKLLEENISAKLV